MHVFTLPVNTVVVVSPIEFQHNATSQSGSQCRAQEETEPVQSAALTVRRNSLNSKFGGFSVERCELVGCDFDDRG